MQHYLMYIGYCLYAVIYQTAPGTDCYVPSCLRYYLYTGGYLPHCSRFCLQATSIYQTAPGTDYRRIFTMPAAPGTDYRRIFTMPAAPGPDYRRIFTMPAAPGTDCYSELPQVQQPTGGYIYHIASVPRRKAGNFVCLPPVWNLRAASLITLFCLLFCSSV